VALHGWTGWSGFMLQSWEDDPVHPVYPFC
jgi:hypothetical protein